MTNANTSVLKALIPAAEDVKKGDIITVGDDGLGYFAVPPTDPEARFRPLSQARTITVQAEELDKYIPAIGTLDGSKHQAVASVRLVSGNYLVVFIAGGNVMVASYGSNGVLKNKTVLASTDGVHLDLAIAVLTNGSIAVAFAAGAENALAVAIVDEDADLLHAVNKLDNITAVASLSIAPLSGSQFVLGYSMGEFRSPGFTVFDEEGAVQVSPVMVEQLDATSKVSNNQSVAVVPTSIFGFAFVYGRMIDTVGVVQMQMYGMQGQRVGELMKISRDMDAAAAGPFVKAVALQGGNIAIGMYGGQNAGFQLQLMDPTGKAQGVNHVLDYHDNQPQPNRMQLEALADGNLGVVWTESRLAGASVVTPSGSFVFRRSNLGECVGSANIAALPDGGAVVVVQGALGLRVGVVDKNLYGELKQTYIASGPACSALVVHGLDNTIGGDANVFVVGAATSMLQLGMFVNYTLPAQAPAGVAMSDTARGQNIEVQIAGPAELRLPFKFPFTLNARDNAIPGQKFSVIGNLALLHGIQA